MRDMNGEAMVAILGEFREAKIIILTTYASDVQGAMNSGARARACLKTRLDKEFLWTIRTVYSGKYTLSEAGSGAVSGLWVKTNGLWIL